MKSDTLLQAFVEETGFGNWFLRSDTWLEFVLQRALDDLQRMMPTGFQPQRILDVGCGFGLSFDELARRFAPDQIAGLDADPHLRTRAGQRAADCACPVTLTEGNAAALPWADGHFDMVFCHQTFHHIVAQEAAMAEFHRVLRPGGVLLFAESTRKYIHSLPIKLLFRHPMDVQKTAEEYIAMVRHVGFDLPDSRVSLPYLWWSRPDMGVLEALGRKPSKDREETLVNAVAVKRA